MPNKKHPSNNNQLLHRPEFGISPKWSAYFSILASLAGTATAIMPGSTEPSPHHELFKSDRVQIGVGGQQVVPSLSEFRLPGVDVVINGLQTVTSKTPGRWAEQTVGSRQEVTEVSTGRAPLEFARVFEQTPGIGEVADQSGIKNYRDKLNQLTADGWRIVKTEYIGQSSDENVTANSGDGRLGADDVKNIKASQARAEKLKEIAESEVPVVANYPSEIIALEGRDNELNEQIAKIAKGRKISVDQLVMGYNLRKINLSPDETETLDKLADQRYSVATTTLVREVPITTYTWHDGELIETTEYKEEFTVVVALIIVPFIGISSKAKTPLTPRPTTGPSRGKQIPPKVIDNERPGHASPTKKRKQPTGLNEGSRGKHLGHQKGSSRPNGGNGHRGRR